MQHELDLGNQNGTAEEWRPMPVPDAIGYEISSLGRVGSYYTRGSWSKAQKAPKLAVTRTIMKPTPLPKGHLVIGLAINGRRRSFLLHRLVLAAFVGPCPAGMVACHNNGDPADNRVKNLRWDTGTSNQIDRIYHDKGHHWVKLPPEDIPWIWERIRAGEPLADIARDYGVDQCTIGAIANGKSWRHVTGMERGGAPAWATSERATDSSAVYPQREFLEADRELWGTLPGFEGYRISTHGRVRTCMERGRGPGIGKGCRLVASDHWRDLPMRVNPKTGYPVFHASDGNGSSRDFTMHEAVLLTFAGPRPPRFVACHKDGNRQNNHVQNLRWDTNLANELDKVRYANATK